MVLSFLQFFIHSRSIDRSDPLKEGVMDGTWLYAGYALVLAPTGAIIGFKVYWKVYKWVQTKRGFAQIEMTIEKTVTLPADQSPGASEFGDRDEEFFPPQSPN